MSPSSSFDNLKNRFIITLNDELKDLEPFAVQRKAAEILGNALKADRVVYKTVASDKNERVFKVDEFFQTEKAPFSAGLYPFHLFGDLIQQQEDGVTVHIEDVSASTIRPNEKAVYESISVASFIQVPLIKEGKFVASLAVHQTTPRKWTAHEIELVQETAQRTWGAVEHARIDAALKQFNSGLEELVRQRTQEIEDTKLSLQQNKDLLQSIFAAIPHAMYVFKVNSNITDEQGFELVLHNQQSIEPNVESVLQDAVKQAEKYGVVDRFKEVLATGMSQDFEIEFTEEKKWFHFKASTVNQLLIVMRENITSRKNMEAQLIDNQALVESVFNTSLVSMSLLEAVYDENGNIYDFVIKLTNQALNKETGRSNLAGKLYAAEYPGIKEVGLLDIMINVMKTGISDGKEYYYPYDGFNKWYSCMFIKTDGSLVATNLDITERKEAEQVIVQNAAMIKAIAESAPNMLYAIDIQSDKQIYSNANIEELVKLSQQAISDLGKDFFKKYVHPDDLDNFSESIKELEDAIDTNPKTHTYRLVDSENVTHWIKTTRAVYQRDANGKATHIVGVSQDITQEINLSERNKELERQTEILQKQQQQAILEASLMAQEEERKRISDNLHNGMGQVLYGAKARLDQLQVVSEEDWIKLNQVKELLTSTIAESRKLSHQLMPPMLDDYGLIAALTDICNTLSGKTRFIFSHRGLDENLDRYLKMMIYRIIQELMINIVNHADATIAQVTLRQEKTQIRIVVEDNGTGFNEKDRQTWGLGLVSIEAKLRMLNGKFVIEGNAGQSKGTKITLDFNLP